MQLVIAPEYFTSGTEELFLDDIDDAWINVSGFLTGAVYQVIGWSVWSTTIGKRVLRLYVVRKDGSKLNPLRAFGRYLAYILSSITFGIGFIMIGLRSDKRGLHDLVSNTVVVRRR